MKPKHLGCVVGYVRVSTEEQARQGISLEAQRAKIEAWAMANETTLLNVFEDAGISGCRMENREGLQRALRLTCERKAILVVCSLSRLSRSTQDTLRLADRLARGDADLVSLSERIDTTSAAGKMVFRLLAVLNEFERDQVSERTSAALQHKKAKGEVYSPVPYGFVREGNRLMRSPEESEVLSFMRRCRSEGRSLQWIADKLNSDEIPAKNGGKWFPSSVRCVLNRRERGV